jgi:hypothetical protein
LWRLKECSRGSPSMQVDQAPSHDRDPEVPVPHSVNWERREDAGCKKSRGLLASIDLDCSCPCHARSVRRAPVAGGEQSSIPQRSRRLSITGAEIVIGTPGKSWAREAANLLCRVRAQRAPGRKERQGAKSARSLLSMLAQRNLRRGVQSWSL